MSQFTPEQTRAIQAAGNVAVVAGAGAGKTRTLVERILSRLLSSEGRTSLDRMMVVTFTEAAAAELRRRIRSRLEAELERVPTDSWLREQLALLEIASIGTLHSFCYRLVRDHFHELDLDPGVVVMEEMEAGLLGREILDGILRGHYESPTARGEEVRELVMALGGGRDEPVRALVHHFHAYTQTLPEPERWIKARRGELEAEKADLWISWMAEAFQVFRAHWLPVLAGAEAEALVRSSELLNRCGNAGDRAEIAGICRQLQEYDSIWPHGTKKMRKGFEKFFSESEFLLGLAQVTEGEDPLQQDWAWTRLQVLSLLELAKEFSAAFAKAKQEMGTMDFQDLEQFALRLLRPREDGSTSEAVRILQRDLDLVFVDEYQDINPAQDAILRALSRSGDQANRFLVGDVKQSIYRFRLADPKVFQGYISAWGDDRAAGQVCYLGENFRSHMGILRFVNPVFRALMRRQVGGVEYDRNAELRFGNPEGRSHRHAEPPPLEGRVPRVELHLQLMTKETAEAGEDREEAAEESAPVDRNQIEREALLVGRRLKALKSEKRPIWDEESSQLREVEWRDMVILMRSPRARAETYAKVFHQLGIPLSAARSGFSTSMEIRDLLSLLTIFDNPLQDIPVLAVLRSPFVGLSVDELVLIRLAQRGVRYWAALQRFQEAGSSLGVGQEPAEVAAVRASAWEKVDAFLRQYHRWRTWARQLELARCLELILDETGYEGWLLDLDRGEQRYANVQRLLKLARSFDRFQRHGLYRFLRHMGALQEHDFDLEPAPAAAQNAVRLMSIHQSKGLEFPIVVVADLGRKFNLQEGRGRLLFDETYGFCPLVSPPGKDVCYPSLPYWLAVKRQRCESLGEEIRLLYVAFTRACDYLFLVGTAGEERAQRSFGGPANSPLPLATIVGASSSLDWLGALMPLLTGKDSWLAEDEGGSEVVSWRLWRGELGGLPEPEGMETLPRVGEAALPEEVPIPPPQVWEYPWKRSTTEPAKTTASLLRQRSREGEDGESEPLFRFPWRPRIRGKEPSQMLLLESFNAAERGSIHHRFLEHLRLESAGGLASLRAEVVRLQHEGVISLAESSVLDLTALARFWDSKPGKRIRSHPEQVRRELVFTVRFSGPEIHALCPAIRPDLPEEDFVVTQGVVDLAVLRESEIWVVDYKTDDVEGADLVERAEMYALQAKLYAKALEKVYSRPVTEAWLYFLAPGKLVEVDLQGSHSPG